jgi:hypothetical protein
VVIEEKQRMRTFGIILILVSLLSGGRNVLADYLGPQVGTAIIAIVHPESRIVLAADSKLRLITLNEKKSKPGILVTCKINKLSDSIFFVTAGFYGPERFRVVDVVRWAYLEADDLAKTIQLIETRLKAGLEKAYLEIRNKSADFYRREFDKLEKVHVFLFGAQIGKLFIHRREFRARNLSHGIVVDVIRESCPGNLCQGGQSFVFFAGKTDGINQYEASNPIRPGLLSEEVKWFNNAMNAQIKATPQDVGPPINIISIQPTGEARWIQGEDQCKA